MMNENTAENGPTPGPGDVSFYVDASHKTPPVLLLTTNGSFYVHGRPVETDRQIYDAFIEWLVNANPEFQNPLRQALAQAVQVIKSWHNLYEKDLNDPKVKENWNIYYQNAPEMAAIRAMLPETP